MKIIFRNHKYTVNNKQCNNYSVFFRVNTTENMKLCAREYKIPIITRLLLKP